MREGDTVNVFDRAVAAVAPVHAAKRAAARAALKVIDSGYGNYGANMTKKSLRGWEFYGGSAKEDIEDNIDILRQRSRDAYMGIPTASAALKTMRTNVIAGGLMPAPQIDAKFLGLTPEDAEKLQAQIVREFALWADTPVCDADRVDNFYKLQQLTFLSYAMNGDAIVLLPTKEQTGQPYSLRVRLVEADRVCSPDGFDRLVPCTVQGHDVHCIVQGVETDADGMVIAYWVCDRHPLASNAYTSGGPHWTRVEAYTKTTGRRNVLHVMNRERAGQRRGVPMLAPVLEALKQLGRYTDAEITAAVLSAMFTVFVKQSVASDARPFGEMLPPDMLIDAQDQSSIELGPGAILSLNPGEDVQFADPKHPNTGYDAFTNALIRQIGAALEIPPEVLFKQFTTSYSAARGALNEFWRTCSISNIGTVGLATMGAVATAAAVGIADCTKEAQALESSMAPVVRYVDGLADASGAVSDAIADNGKTFKQNYGALKTYIQDLSTDIPRTTDQLTAMSAALGQSGIGVDKQLTTGYLRDTAVAATAMDLDDQTAGNYVAKWEASFNFDHKQVMTLLDQINYLGAHNATTAGEIAQSVNSAASMGQIAGVDPAATAAMATAMQATGVSTDRVGTSISRIYTNLSKGSNATKAQKEMWEELGFTAEGIAKSMQTDGVGTLKEVFTALQDMPDERKVAALSTLFGQWAIEGGAKITNNLGAYEKALEMVSDPSLYTGSMEREFIIQASTSESIDTMVKNSVTALKQDIGTEFLPVKKTLSLAVIDLMNGVRKDMPQLQTLAGTLADLLSAGISKLGDALQAALPYVQKALDYVADNGPQVAGILGGMAGTFAAMKFAPLAGNLLEGAGSLLFGESGGLGVVAGGSERSGGLLGAVGSLFTGGQKFAGNAVGTISNVAEAAGVGTTMANSNMTRTQWGAVTSNGSGSFMQRLENSAIGAYFGIKNRGTLTNQKGTDYKFMQGLMGVAGQITDAKQGGGLLGMAKNAVTSSPIGQYFSGIRAAAGNVANTTIGSKIVGFGKGTIGVSKEILAGIAGPEGLGLTNLVSGAKGLAQNGAGWVAGKAGNVISTVANSGVGQAIGGAAGKVGGVAKGVVSVGSNALGALGNFAGAGAGLLGSVWGPVAGGFGSLFAGAAPVIAAISGIIAVVSILGDHLEDIRGIVVNVFGETGGQVFDVFTGKLQGVADFVTGLFNEGGVAAALAPLQNTITNLFGENAGAAFGGVVTILQSIMGVVGQIVTFATGTVKPIIQDVFTFITGTVLPIILQTFTAAAPTIASIISNIGSAVMTGMQIIGSAIQAAMPIIQGIITVIMTIGSVVVPALLAGFEAFSAGISAVMSAIQGFFQGLITFITGVFSGSWSQAWEGIKQIFGSAFDGLVALCKAPLNAVIAIINKAISGINGLGLTIPKWVPILGGKSFSVNIPTLPMLARGGFTDGVSIAGEAGTEAVISFQRGVRSDNINTWTQAGRMLGVSGEQAAVAAGVPYADGGGAVELATIEATQGNNAVELQEIDTGKPQPEQGGSGTPDGGGQVVFAPQIVVQGNADRAVLESVLDDAQQRFELWYEQMMRRKARTAY